ncbi:hypothetical protein ALC56_06751 [Trachymyrmex septentrionalis]|uniref:Uncharacterized protein n=1 Tax=Trachymyrmex septentrionalis TaxID=34720 RepID=A0A195FEV3_9HYME|nr:hypothetical protein ALC56_06751 [Trachymyrmex septentrionalis]
MVAASVLEEDQSGESIWVIRQHYWRFGSSILGGNGFARRLGVGFVGGCATVSTRNATEKIISRYIGFFYVTFRFTSDTGANMSSICN